MRRQCSGFMYLVAAGLLAHLVIILVAVEHW